MPMSAWRSSSRRSTNRFRPGRCAAATSGRSATRPGIRASWR
jgi:hypothetical protein